MRAQAPAASTQQAAANARKAYDWNWNLPKPPAAPQIAAGGVSTKADGTVDLTWSYSDAQIAAVDPDKGSADFAGFRIYKAATAPRQSSGDIMNAESVSADNSTVIYLPYVGEPNLISTATSRTVPITARTSLP